MLLIYIYVFYLNPPTHTHTLRSLAEILWIRLKIVINNLLVNQNNPYPPQIPIIIPRLINERCVLLPMGNYIVILHNIL